MINCTRLPGFDEGAHSDGRTLSSPNTSTPPSGREAEGGEGWGAVAVLDTGDGWLPGGGIVVGGDITGIG